MAAFCCYCLGIILLLSVIMYIFKITNTMEKWTLNMLLEDKVKGLLKHRKRKILWMVLLLFAFVYLNNTAFFAAKRSGKPVLLAHRGMAQTFTTFQINNLGSDPDLFTIGYNRARTN
jgi:hypothetical protein